MLKIDGINYMVLLFLDNGNWEDTDMYQFSDFDEMNSFIREQKQLSRYEGFRARYTLAEATEDGQINGYTWDAEIPFEEFTEEEIKAAIEEQRAWLIEVDALSTELNKKQREINYYAYDGDYREKQSRLADFVYVCPNCIREIEDCRCKYYPYYLMQIDRLILPVIRELNMKGYKTTGCCAGHIQDDEFKTTGIYICFDQDYDFDQPFPEGAVYTKTKHSLSIVPPSSVYDDLKTWQRETIWALSDWAEMLWDLNDILGCEDVSF